LWAVFSVLGAFSVLTADFAVLRAGFASAAGASAAAGTTGFFTDMDSTFFLI